MSTSFNRHKTGLDNMVFNGGISSGPKNSYCFMLHNIIHGSDELFVNLLDCL